ncbi:MAG: hypothetical protein JWQ39_1599 [Glaciihabitans sp.]|nr:hypothetical protein [Glaciihabitans sp.]
MSRLQFADNTALINFCLVGRLDLLERLMNGAGAWTATVRIECEESSRYPGCSDLANVHKFLGEPYTPQTEEELRSVEEAWEFLREPGDGPEKHLGEAETVAIVTTRDLVAILVTDDTGAMRLAGRHGIPAATTVDLFILAVKARLLDEQTAWDYICDLRDNHGRFLPRAPESFADHRIRCGSFTL